MKHVIFPLFLFAAAPLSAQYTHQLAVVNDVFEPQFLVVEAGDPIELRLTGSHTLTQVSAATFHANGAVPNGGLRIGHGLGYGFTGVDANETTFTLRDTGSYYFVSEGPTGAIAKARIEVIAPGNTGVGAAIDQTKPQVYPNPAYDQVRFKAHEHLDMMSVEVFDEAGRRVLESVVRGNEPLSVMNLPAGYYTIRLTDGMSRIYGVERLVIEKG